MKGCGGSTEPRRRKNKRDICWRSSQVFESMRPMCHKSKELFNPVRNQIQCHLFKGSCLSCMEENILSAFFYISAALRPPDQPILVILSLILQCCGTEEKR